MTNKVRIKGWKKYGKHPLKEHASGFYQKRIENEIFANLIVYPQNKMLPKSYVLEIQIPEYNSFIGKTINVEAFSYKVINWDKIEEDVVRIINALTK